jgi:hypothetical protein
MAYTIQDTFLGYPKITATGATARGRAVIPPTSFRRSVLSFVRGTPRMALVSSSSSRASLLRQSGPGSPTTTTTIQRLCWRQMPSVLWRFPCLRTLPANMAGIRFRARQLASRWLASSITLTSMRPRPRAASTTRLSRVIASRTRLALRRSAFPRAASLSLKSTARSWMTRWPLNQYRRGFGPAVFFAPSQTGTDYDR